MTRIPSRRAIVAGLAVAPVAGLPAMAGTVGADPALEALAEYDHRHAIELAARKASRSAYHALEAAADAIGAPVVFEGEKIFTLQQLERLNRQACPSPLPEAELEE